MTDSIGDVGLKEDALQGVIDAVSAEWHCINSWNQSGDDRYLELKGIIRDRRQKLMTLIVKKENENFCITKHLASLCKTLEEVGNRYLKIKKFDLAKEMFSDSQLILGCIMLLNEGVKNESK